MPFQFKPLPYDIAALEPFISKRTMSFHHDKHYKKYVATLNELTAQNSSGKSLQQMMMDCHKEQTAIFQNAAQAWNHEFYWNCLTPESRTPSAQMTEILSGHFGSIDEFKADFSQCALGLFGSGWVWVVRNVDGDLEIRPLADAENPLTSGQTPLLVCDLWEHAYYLDHQNERNKYLTQFWQILNWQFFEHNIHTSVASRENKMSHNPKATRSVGPNGELNFN